MVIITNSASQEYHKLYINSILTLYQAYAENKKYRVNIELI